MPEMLADVKVKEASLNLLFKEIIERSIKPGEMADYKVVSKRQLLIVGRICIEELAKRVE